MARNVTAMLRELKNVSVEDIDPEGEIWDTLEQHQARPRVTRFDEYDD